MSLLPVEVLIAFRRQYLAPLNCLLLKTPMFPGSELSRGREISSVRKTGCPKGHQLSKRDSITIDGQVMLMLEDKMLDKGRWEGSKKVAIR
jgi:hypothetical protein